MTDEGRANEQVGIPDALRTFCLRLVRYLSNSALDPHRYFEQKFTGAVRHAKSRAELIETLVMLLGLFDELPVAEKSLAAFDRSLQEDRLPSLSLLLAEQTRPVGLVLASGRIRTADEAALVETFLQSVPESDADRIVAERMLASHAQG